MKRTLAALASLSAITSCAQQDERPNIILFLVDDMGWQDTSLPFHTDTTNWNRRFQTPNMERLAEQGVKFTNAYACSVSSPSRVSLMTGANATRHKVTNWTLFKDTPTDKKSDILEFGKWNYNGLQEDTTIDNSYHATTLATVLRNNGYQTLFVGKAHFGAVDTPGQEPLNVGFDVNVAGFACGGPASYLAENGYGANRNAFNAVPHLDKYHGTDTFLTEALTIEAKEVMNKAIKKNDPFFLYFAHYAIHTPFEADVRFYDKYKEQGFEEWEARFATLVEGMDKSLGDILDYVEEKGIADNTIIMFMSDNGGYSVGVRTNTFGGEAKNAPLRAGKGALYEGGIREPMLVYAPGITEAGTVNDSPLLIEDFFPTILELAGVNVAEQTMTQEIDSKSFMAAIQGESINNERPLFWHYPNFWGESQGETGRPSSAVRIGNMKYIHSYERELNELYDLSNDIGEKRNLLRVGSMADRAKYKEIAKEMATVLSDKLRAENSPMPIVKKTGLQSKYPDQTL
ncbi:MAG: sulfatase [Rikenellaceae bacterium]